MELGDKIETKPTLSTEANPNTQKGTKLISSITEFFLKNDNNGGLNNQKGTKPTSSEQENLNPQKGTKSTSSD